MRAALIFILLSLGACATRTPAPPLPSLDADLILAGKVESSTEIITFCNASISYTTKEMSWYCGDAAFDGQLQTFKTVNGETIKFTVAGYGCPPGDDSQQTYLVFLHYMPHFLYESRGPEDIWDGYEGYVVTACTPLDKETAVGFHIQE